MPAPRLLALPLLLASLLAERVSAAPAAAAEDIEELVVTATRMQVERLETPYSLDRLDSQTIDLVGSTHASEILNRVPGVMIQRGSGQESLNAIRSPVLTGAGSCGAFLFLENGVPIRPIGFCNVNELLEINTEQADAIEVLRGTGSALYGSNSVHGTINVLHDLPENREPLRAGIMAGPSDYGRLDLRGTYLGADVNAGLKALYTHDGGWRDESGFDEAKLVASLDGGESLPYRVDLAGTTLDQETAGFIIGKDAYRDDALSRSNPNPEAYRDVHAVRLTALLQPAIAWPAALELRPYVRTSRMEFLQHFLLGQPVERNGQESAGILSTLLWTFGERAQLLTGVDVEYADSFLLQFQDGPTTDGSPAANAIRPAGKHYDYTVTSSVAAAYGQLEYALAADWHLGAGVRVEYVGYDYDNRMLAGNTDQNGVPCQPTACLYSRPADRRDEFVNVAPKLSLRWQPTAGLSLYANASRGFRPPEMTELYRLQRDQSVADLDSEQVDAYEAGFKLARAPWQLELAGFDMTKRNVILRESNGYNVSNGRTTHRGLEYQLAWQPLESVSLNLGGTYARHRYDFSRAIEGGETIVKGNDIDTAPRELWRAEVAVSPWSDVSAEAEWLVVGDYYLDAANQHSYGGHELLNLRGRWAFAPGWALVLRLNNALDVDYADRADFAFGSYRYFPGRPRALFAELNWTAR